MDAEKCSTEIEHEEHRAFGNMTDGQRGVPGVGTQRDVERLGEDPARKNDSDPPERPGRGNRKADEGDQCPETDPDEHLGRGTPGVVAFRQSARRQIANPEIVRPEVDKP